MVGLDVGSTTVKAVVVDAATDQILWQDYQRHDTKQPEKVLEFLQAHRSRDRRLRSPSNTRMFITGSGGNGMAKSARRQVRAGSERRLAGGGEAVSRSAARSSSWAGRTPRSSSSKTDPETGRKKKIPSMNDKCAGGTGAVIDKINAKLRIPAEQLCEMGYKGIKLHPVAGKCGVFAETDINGLQKMGVPPDELMASLFEAIVHAEPLGADARQHAAPVRAAARRPQLLHQGHAGLLEGTTSRRSGKSARYAAARGRRRRKT